MDALVTMIGWVGSPVEFKLGRNRVSLANFRLACTPRIRRGEEWVDAPTTWLTVTAYRALAEHLDASVGKGEPVIVVGRLRTQSWTDEQGHPHERTVLEATTVGHDLTRGTASFRKAVRRAQPEPEPAGPGEPEPDGSVPASTAEPAGPARAREGVPVG